MTDRSSNRQTDWLPPSSTWHLKNVPNTILFGSYCIAVPCFHSSVFSATQCLSFSPSSSQRYYPSIHLPTTPSIKPSVLSSTHFICPLCSRFFRIYLLHALWEVSNETWSALQKSYSSIQFKLLQLLNNIVTNTFVQFFFFF